MTSRMRTSILRDNCISIILGILFLSFLLNDVAAAGGCCGGNHDHSQCSSASSVSTVANTYSSFHLFFYALVISLCVSFVSLCGMLAVMYLGDAILWLQLPIVGFGTASMLCSALVLFMPEAMHILGSADITGRIVLLGVLSAMLIEMMIHAFSGHHHSHSDMTAVTPHGHNATNVKDQITNKTVSSDDSIVLVEQGQNAPCRAAMDSLAWNCLIGDALHNLVDGIMIGTIVSAQGPAQGLIVMGAIILHELPQEIADLCILLHAGWNMRKALIRNALSTLTIVIGAVGGVLVGRTASIEMYCMAFVSGQFLYIALGQLMPSLSHLGANRNKIGVVIAFALGIVATYGMTFLPEQFHSHAPQ